MAMLPWQLFVFIAAIIFAAVKLSGVFAASV